MEKRPASFTPRLMITQPGRQRTTPDSSRPSARRTVSPDANGERGQDLEVDANGRLYSNSTDPTITFARWEPDLETSQVFGPRFRKIEVNWPEQAVEAGQVLQIKAALTGRPLPENMDQWQVMIRPSDGYNLRWSTLDAPCKDGSPSVSG